MDNESIKIEIQDQDENSDMADLNKNNLKGGNDMETENKTVLNDYNDELPQCPHATTVLNILIFLLKSTIELLNTRIFGFPVIKLL